MKLTPDQLRQSAAAMLALADGTPIEFQGRDGTWYPSGDIDCDYPHRPKPAWKLPPPPAGKRWHRDDFTEEMLPIIDGKQTRPLLLDEVPLVGDEHECGNHPWFVRNLHGYPIKSSHTRHRTNRDLPALPAAPVVRPLRPDEIPMSAVFRTKTGARYAPGCINSERIYFNDAALGFQKSFETLVSDGWEISTDGEKTFGPCTTEAP